MAAQDIQLAYTVTVTRTVPRKAFPASMSTQDIVNQEAVNRNAGEQAARLIMRRDPAIPYTATVVVTEVTPSAP